MSGNRNSPSREDERSHPSGRAMISHNLATALLETIQEHARIHRHGKMDLERTLSALGDIASGLLAELTTADDRIAHYSALIDGIRQATAVKILSSDRPSTRQ